MVHISVPFTNLCQRIARCLPQARCLCNENVAIGFKTSIEAYFMEREKQRYDAGSARGEQITPYLLNEVFLGNSAKFKMVPVLR